MVLLRLEFKIALVQIKLLAIVKQKNGKKVKFVQWIKVLQNINPFVL